MGFVADCKAVYHGDQDSIQIIAIIASEAGQSLNAQIKSARVDLIYNDHTIDTIEFTSEHYIIPSDDINGLGDYRLFFFHLPVRHELEVAIDVELINGQKSHTLRPVGREKDPDEGADFSNPMLAGRDPLDWKLIERIDYRREL